jgi:hypothetical protein
MQPGGGAGHASLLQERVESGEQIQVQLHVSKFMDDERAFVVNPRPL